MGMYLLGAGLLVGIVYSVLGARLPVPPLVALIGLLGSLVGEQLLPVGQRLLAGRDLASAWQQSTCTAHLFGTLSRRSSPRAGDSRSVTARKES